MAPKEWTKSQLLKYPSDKFEVVCEREEGENNSFFTDLCEALSFARKELKSNQYDRVYIVMQRAGYENAYVWCNGEYDYYSEPERI